MSKPKEQMGWEDEGMGVWGEKRGIPSATRSLLPPTPPSSHTPTLLLALLLAACATPVMPTGGPPDQTPPAVVEAVPAAGAVEVEADEVRITFSEYVDPGSFSRALSVSPAFDGRLDVGWSRRTAVVTFPEPLRENTTYVLTLDTNLRDLNGVALREPITLAFSTGPEINRGRLSGRVASPERGGGVAGVDVYAYAVPDGQPPAELPDRPDYRTQTNEQGQFTLTYLSEQPYYVVAVQDRNRNRRPDALEPYAVPPSPVLMADTTRQDSTRRWLVIVRDTVPPVPQRVRPLSDRRFAVRFSEPVRFVARDPAAWMLRDTLGNAPAIEALYQPPDDPFQVYVQTAPLPPRPHRVRPVALADTSGNPVQADTLRFTPAAAADTLGLRFETFVPDTVGAAGGVVLPPGQAPGVRFNQPVDNTRLHEAVSVTDTTGQALAYTATSPDGVTYRVETAPPLQPGQALRIEVDGARLSGPDSVFARTFQRLPASETGELSGVVTAPDTAATVVVELYAADAANAPDAPRRVQAGPEGRFVFRDLPAGTYRLRAFVDRNTNLRWDGGRLAPYEPAEPLTWLNEPQRVRARWETALPDTLRLAPPAPVLPDSL